MQKDNSKSYFIDFPGDESHDVHETSARVRNMLVNVSKLLTAPKMSGELTVPHFVTYLIKKLPTTVYFCIKNNIKSVMVTSSIDRFLKSIVSIKKRTAMPRTPDTRSSHP
ncbi:uncharacterized protein LOC122502980 [Leptopilina heterotoma]|uniref:uncharacterized protein LOC122502980 n=1 Tax=Leptopilina heterotoma TaxID=63436 RepID=UPI001CA8927C|nr:uncharacterized protein LOC122502980 [Leptopilina heterotoma]